jgi:hypothetical protein
MVEFASGAERDKILALDHQRRFRIRQRIKDQPPPPPEEGDRSSSNSPTKPYAFEIKITVERCTSDRFVRTVLSSGRSSTRRQRSSRSDHKEPLSIRVSTDSTTQSTMTSPSSRIVNRCIVIRKCSEPGSNDAADSQIPEAPPYDKKNISDDASIRSGDSSMSQQPFPPSRMEIRSGDLCEVVVRGVTIRGKSNLAPAMVIELESEECVERILLAEDAKQTSDSAAPTTLAIPVKLDRVKSERYARICLGNIKALPRSPEKNTRSRIGNGAKDSLEEANDDNDDEGIQSTVADETIDVKENGGCEMNGETGEENVDNNFEEDVSGPVSVEQQIKDLKKEANNLRTDSGRWKARFQKAYKELSQLRSSGNDENGARQKVDDEKPRSPLPSSQSQTQSEASEERDRQQEWLEERRKNGLLEEKVRGLLVENDNLKAARSTESSSEDDNKAPESSQQQEQQQDVLAGNDKPKARVADIDKLVSELDESKALQKQTEQARNKLEEENSGLLRYVLELEGHRNGQAVAEEERNKELEKKHSDLSTLYRFVHAQADQSATDLGKAIEEKDVIAVELQGIKSAWKSRMETQRNLEKTKGKDDDKVCIDCETVKFYATLEELMNEGGADEEAKPGEGNPTIPSENGHSVDDTTTTPTANGVPPEQG